MQKLTIFLVHFHLWPKNGKKRLNQAIFFKNLSCESGHLPDTHIPIFNDFWQFLTIFDEL